MDNLIARYVHDVSRRLPEKERDEVSKELNANILDMLPENADESDIRRVLYQLGSPASLAEKYRQRPRHLISPAVYDDYERALKWVLPLCGLVVMTVGMVWGAIDAIKDGMVDVSYLIGNIISKGLSLGVAATFHGLVWTTVGFVIAERGTGKADEGKKETWQIEDLPEVTPGGKNRIPLSDSIAEMVITVVFSAVAILACSGILPIVFIIQNGDMQIRSLFSADFLAACIPAIVVMAILAVGECAIKMKVRRWSPLVCVAVIVSSLANMGIMVYLINRADLFSAEFAAFLQSIDWAGLDLLRFMGTGGVNPMIIFVKVVIVICALAQCGQAVYRTIRSNNRQ